MNSYNIIKNILKKKYKIVINTVNDLFDIIIKISILLILFYAVFSILNIQANFYPVISLLIQVSGIIVALLPILITGLIRENDKNSRKFLLEVLSIEAVLTVSLIAGVVFIIFNGSSGTGYTIYELSGFMFGITFITGLVKFVQALVNFRYALAKKYGIDLDREDNDL